MDLTEEPQPVEQHPAARPSSGPSRRYRIVILLLAVAFLFVLYVNGLSHNPPGFYVDESGIAYNAYLIGHTGAGEFGERFPLFFQFYTDGWVQWANPTQIYLLAVPFLIFKPSIWLARVFSATWIFAACLMLGLLAKHISGRRRVGLIVALLALATPWLFEVGRLVFETYFYPMAIVLFLLALYRAQRQQSWNLLTVGTLAATLMLLTYTYTIGRLLGPLLAFGLILFPTDKDRLLGIAKTWFAYGVTLVPLLIFKLRHPEALTQRFYMISYIKPNSPWSEILPKFVRRYMEDCSLLSLLIDGDSNPRHHMPGSLGSFLIGVFILAIIGLIVVLVRRWREPWWRFIVFGTLASIVPGALTLDQFHSLRLVTYPIFLLVLTIPALEFLLERAPSKSGEPLSLDQTPAETEIATNGPSGFARRLVLISLLVAVTMQFTYFQYIFRREGPERGYVFDAAYKDVYDAAVALPDRPIYLQDGTSPGYVHALWYATVDGRNRADFIHLNEEMSPPAGALVIGSQPNCVNCQVIKQSGDYMLYRSY